MVMHEMDSYFEPLSSIEANHMYTVLKSTIERLALVGSIKVDPVDQAAELTLNVGEEISKMLDDQKRLEMRYEELTKYQQQLRHQPNRLKIKENKAELQAVSMALKASTKALCRNLKDNPNVTENMAKVTSERASLQNLFTKALGELGSSGWAHCIADMVLAEEKGEVIMRETIDRERLTTTAVRELRSLQRNEQNSHEDQMKQKRKILEGLKEELKSVKSLAVSNSRFNERDYMAHNQHLKRLEVAEVEELARQVQEIQQRHTIEVEVHRALQQSLTNEAEELLNTAENWKTRAQVDIKRKEDELKALEIEHQKTLEALSQAEKKFQVEEEARELREAIASEQKRKKLQFDILNAEMSKAATKIQSVWRGYKTRQLQQGKKGGKKGKGKKKK